MKKLIVLMGILSFSTSLSFAYLDEATTSNVEVLRAQGYSESALRIIDTTNSFASGKNGTYVRYFQPKQHKGLGKPYTVVKRYFDPIQDDDLFGEHQINFSNAWDVTGEEPSYSTQLRPKEHVENL